MAEQDSSTGAWQSVRQALLILQQLQKAPASKKELIAAVQAEFSDTYRQSSAKAQSRAFERDLKNLRERLGAKIEYDRSLRAYVLYDTGDLLKPEFPREALSSIAFLLDAFGSNSGAYEILKPLFEWLDNTLAPEQVQQLEKANSPLRIDLFRRDEGTISTTVLNKIRFAMKHRRIAEFLYLSPRHENREPRKHKVEPYEICFENGHFYLWGYCLRWQNPDGYVGGDRFFKYRLDHILAEDFALLGGFKADQRPQRRTLIRYKVAPRLWRGGVTRHFEEMTIGEPDENDWVEISGKAEDLFEAHRILLKYGELCQATAPPKLIEMMKRAAQGMSQLYDKNQ